jgi:hypothetical protein
MIARRIALTLGVLTMGFAGLYVFVYLYRWEWNRAMFCLGLFVAVEIAMATALVLSRLARVGRRLDAFDPAVLQRIEEAAPEARRPFAWLDEAAQGRTAVFVPILMGAGIVLSGIAWLVERLAARTAGPVMERGLARRLGALALPDSLVPPAVSGASAGSRRSLFQP